MAKKLTQEEFVERVLKLNPDIDLSDFVYVNSQTKGLAKCKKCGNEWMVVANSLLLGIGCRKCFDNRLSKSKKWTPYKTQQAIYDAGCDISIISGYTDTKHPCLVKCNRCGKEWTAKPAYFLQGNDCTCVGERQKFITQRATEKEKMLEDLRDKYKQYGYDISFNGDYIVSDSQIAFTCPRHGVFYRKYTDAVKRICYCTECAQDKIKKEKEERQEIKLQRELLRKQKIEKNAEKKSRKSQAKYTREDVINMIEEKHPGKFDFSEMVFTNVNEKITLICKDCGNKWNTLVYTVRKAKSCPMCQSSRNTPYSQEEWISIAKKKYEAKGIFFDYSRVKYDGNKCKVTIGCPKHGWFDIGAKSFLKANSYGCKKCNAEHPSRVLTQEEAVEKIKRVHGVSILLDKFKFTRTADKAIFVCPTHGEWEANVGNVMGGCGCPKCANEANGLRHRLDFDELMERLMDIHGDKGYDFSAVTPEIYKGVDTKVSVVCPEHGTFTKTFHALLAGQGCPKCARIVAGGKMCLSFAEFVERANEIHQSKYEYDESTYKKAGEQISIKCPKHGWFKQVGFGHLSGCGCPKCNYSRLERRVEKCLMDNNIDFTPQCRLSWLKPQSLDFYLTDYNIGIECQGIQHFESLRGYTDEMVAKCKERDAKKKKLCIENNCKLIYYFELTDLNKYMSPDDIHFNDLDSLIDYIKKQPKTNEK